MDAVIPTTELEAVNTILESVGQSPVNTLVGSDDADVIGAVDRLRKTTREVLLKGWTFNTDEEWIFTPSSTPPHHITLPNNVAFVDPLDPTSKIVERERKLYDAENRTFSFPVGTEIKCKVIWFQDFNVLPEAARNYITISAARIYSDKFTPDVRINQFSMRDETRARVTLRRLHGLAKDRSILRDSDSVKRIIAR